MLITQDLRIKQLISCLDSNSNKFEALYNKAKDLTFQNFGIKRHLFNPVYVSDICLADCPYCGYRSSNKGIVRKTLKTNETIQEVMYLINRGVKNILLLAGDYKHEKYIEMLETHIKAIRATCDINWLGIEVATLEIEQYKTLYEAGAESITVFQETYNKKRYSELHQMIEYKGDFDYRYFAQERAIRAGFKEIGFGVLYGIGFWKEDTIKMAEQALDIQSKYPDIKFRFSFPRLQLSKGQDEACKTEEVTEDYLLRIIVGIRLLFPDSSLVLTGRESVDYLIKNASIINVLGYNGSTIVGGYTGNSNGLSQFQLNSKNDFYDFKTLMSIYELA